jgi:hypothetical protein
MAVRIQKAYAGTGGILDFKAVRAWGHGYAGGACYYMNFLGRTGIELPKDHYRVTAFEAAFVGRDHSYLGNSSKFEAALMQHGMLLDLEVGQTRCAIIVASLPRARPGVSIAKRKLHMFVGRFVPSLGCAVPRRSRCLSNMEKWVTPSMNRICACV